MIHLHQKLDDLVALVGPHRRTMQVISFPQRFNFATRSEDRGVIHDTLFSGDVEYIELGVLGANWNAIHYKTIIETYGTLRPGEENITRIRREWDAYRREYPRESSALYSPDEEFITAKIMALTFPSQEGASHSDVMERYRQEFQYYLYEALLNALGRGNNCDLSKQILVDAWYGERGLLFKIEDEGEGFCVDAILSKLASGQKHSTPSTRKGRPGHGLGMRAFYHPNFMNRASADDYFFGYNTKGNEWYYLTLFGPRTFVPDEFRL